MSLVRAEFMGRNPQRLLIGASFGEACAVVVQRLFGANSRTINKELGFDRKTIENVRLGKAGSGVIQRFLLARKETHDDAWDVADAILEQVLGESRSEYEERKLRELRKNTENAISLHEERKARRQALAERASAVDHQLARRAADETGDAPRRRGRSA